MQPNQKISSETYPISKKWIISAVFRSLFLSFGWWLILLLLLININYSFVYKILFFFILFFVYITWYSILKKNFYFEFTPEYILLRNGVIRISETRLSYKSISEVLNRRGPIDIILGLSNLVIINARTEPGYKGNLYGGEKLPTILIPLIWQPKDKVQELKNIIKDIVTL